MLMGAFKRALARLGMEGSSEMTKVIMWLVSHVHLLEYMEFVEFVTSC